MADQEEKEETKEEEKAIPKAKIVIDFNQVGKKANLRIVKVDKKGKITKIIEQDDKAMAALKKFVSSL